MTPLIEQLRGRQQPNITDTDILISLNKRNVTKFVETAMKRFIPLIYAQRQKQEIEKEPAVPVFICTTAFPNVSCPLFVYEPRYRLMVRRAIESGTRQFGIALPQTGKSRYVDIGTMLDIRDCVQLPDGCSILSTVGTRRFKVIARSEKDGYDTAKIEMIEDEPMNGKYTKLIRELHDRVLTKAINWYDNLPPSIKDEILKSFGQMPCVEKEWQLMTDGPAWAWWIIAILPLNQSLKVGILATTSVEKRLRAIEKTLNLEHLAAKQKRALCAFTSQSCANEPTCTANDCCRRTIIVPSTVSEPSHHLPLSAFNNSDTIIDEGPME